MGRERYSAAALILFFSAIWMWQAGSAEFVSNDESRSGVIVRDILENGHWLLPRTPDGHVAEKPPLHYWLAAAAARVFGTSEAAIRAVSVFMAAGMLALVAALVSMCGAGRAAPVAVAALASNALVTVWARKAMVDTTFAFFVTGALTAYVGARVGRLRPRTAAALGGLSAGLAVLSKGPLGLALPLVAVCGDGLVSTRGRIWNAHVHWPAVTGALVLAVLVALAWYLPAYSRAGPEFLDTAVLSENVDMPLGQARGLGVAHLRPLYHYPLLQIGALLTMLPLLPRTVQWALSRDAGAARAPLLAWLGFGLALFMVAANRRSHYLLPLQPACAIMVALAVERCLDDPDAKPWLRVGALVSGVVVLLLTAGLIAVSTYPEWLPAVRLRRSVVLFVPAGLGLGAAFLAVWRGPTRLIVRAAVCLALFVALASTTLFRNAKPERDAMRPFAAAMRGVMPADVRVVAQPPIYGYALDFYWPQPIPRDERARETAAWFFIRLDLLKTVPGRFEVVGVCRTKWEDRSVALVRRR